MGRLVKGHFEGGTFRDGTFYMCTRKMLLGREKGTKEKVNNKDKN